MSLKELAKLLSQFCVVSFKKLFKLLSIFKLSFQVPLLCKETLTSGLCNVNLQSLLSNDFSLVVDCIDLDVNLILHSLELLLRLLHGLGLELDIPLQSFSSFIEHDDPRVLFIAGGFELNYL